MNATLTIRDSGDVIVIHAHGKLALGHGPHSLHTQLQNLVARGHSRILLRMTGVDSLDSADIGELMAGYAVVAMAGGELKLLDPGDRVAEVLQVTAIDRLLETHHDEATASWSLRQELPKFALAVDPESHSECYVG